MHRCLRKCWDSASQASDLFIEPSPYTFRSHFHPSPPPLVQDKWTPPTPAHNVAYCRILPLLCALDAGIVQCIDFLHVTGNWRVAIVVVAAAVLETLLLLLQLLLQLLLRLLLLLPACVWGIARLIALAVAVVWPFCRHMYKLIIMRRLKTQESIVGLFACVLALPSVQCQATFDPIDSNHANRRCELGLPIATDVGYCSCYTSHLITIYISWFKCLIRNLQLSRNMQQIEAALRAKLPLLKFDCRHWWPLFEHIPYTLANIHISPNICCSSVQSAVVAFFFVFFCCLNFGSWQLHVASR